ncbi:hypothetical protein K470DRAFT_264508 [Piedraia hortae CBS 480.64]|uniref:Uncharacterized protein n=1 Tax=Piedraia hortae CBS 480.64 TaxID=1314780 RepID=A0A6A7BYS9_9PEZI|nr:hypothetical protein K470DRAFT_264508 [Piedraia hortae CBS 480.64]
MIGVFSEAREQSRHNSKLGVNLCTVLKHEAIPEKYMLFRAQCVQIRRLLAEAKQTPSKRSTRRATIAGITPVTPKLKFRAKSELPSTGPKIIDRAGKKKEDFGIQSKEELREWLSWSKSKGLFCFGEDALNLESKARAYYDTWQTRKDKLCAKVEKMVANDPPQPVQNSCVRVEPYTFPCAECVVPISHKSGGPKADVADSRPSPAASSGDLQVLHAVALAQATECRRKLPMIPVVFNVLLPAHLEGP